jgi:hypothetical protein
MALYKKRPEKFEAIQFTNTNIQDCLDFFRKYDKHGSADFNIGTGQLQYFNLYGTNYVNVKSWLVVEVIEGIVDVYSDEEFHNLFVKVGEGNATI